MSMTVYVCVHIHMHRGKRLEGCISVIPKLCLDALGHCSQLLRVPWDILKFQGTKCHLSGGIW